MSKKHLERSIDFFVEVEEIMDQIYEIYDKYRGRGLAWNRFRGDATSRIVAFYLERHLPENVKVIKSAWVEGCENEFDLLIVYKDAKPIGFTGAYPRNQVRLLIEVKTAGVFYKQKEVKRRLSKQFKTWEDKTDKPVLYLSFWEAAAHVQEVFKALGKDKAFIMRVERKELKYTEWERFIEKVNTILNTNKA